MAIVPCLSMWFLWDLFTCTINDVDVEVSGLVLLATIELIRKVPECVLHIAVDLEILGLVPHVTSLVDLEVAESVPRCPQLSVVSHLSSCPRPREGPPALASSCQKFLPTTPFILYPLPFFSFLSSFVFVAMGGDEQVCSNLHEAGFEE